jgi:NitT/TauT family transport system substrate-binding protein
VARALRLALGILLAFAPGLAAAGAPQPKPEIAEVTFAQQNGLTYLPFMVMEEKKLVEKRCKEAGLDTTTKYMVMGGAAPINDGIVAERVQVAALGVPPLVQLWSKTKGSLEVKAIGAMTSMPMFFTTTNPKIKTIKDVDPAVDKIALPSVKIAVQAVTLQMACAKEFGKENYAKLDKITVSMPHPEATAAMLNRTAGLTCNISSPPYQYQQLRGAGIRKFLSSYDVLGGPHTFIVALSTEKFRNENPRTFDAVAGALGEAIEWINANKEAAAELYLQRSKSKEEKKEIVAMLNDPEIEFTLTPKGMMKYARFMHEADPKNIKNVPADWKELCFPFVHDKAGS